MSDTIVNKEEIDTFLFKHRFNGCKAIKGKKFDSKGLTYSVSWVDTKTGDAIKVIYKRDLVRCGVCQSMCSGDLNGHCNQCR